MPQNNIILTAKIISIHDGGMRISTDQTEYNLADVVYDKGLTLDLRPSRVRSLK